MACHSSEITINIVGLEASNHGRSFENQKVCCSVVKVDSVVRLNMVQLLRKVDKTNPEVEATAIAVYLVSGGMDTCRAGFTRRHLLKYKDEYDARLAQVTEVFSASSEFLQQGKIPPKQRMCSCRPN